MRNFLLGDFSLSNLIGDLKNEVKQFVKEELELAKKEMLEKASHLARNSVLLAVGGFAAYAGLIVLLGGIGLVIAFAFKQLGLDPTLAMFIGLAIAGSLAIGIGTAMVLKGIKTFSAASLAPEKTIDTIKNLNNPVPAASMTPGPQPVRSADTHSSDDIQQSVYNTEERIGEEGRELKRRFSPEGLKEMAANHMKRHPVMWGSVALGSLVTGGLVFGRKLWMPLVGRNLPLPGKHAKFRLPIL